MHREYVVIPGEQAVLLPDRREAGEAGDDAVRQADGSVRSAIGPAINRGVQWIAMICYGGRKREAKDAGWDGTDGETIKPPIADQLDDHAIAGGYPWHGENNRRRDGRQFADHRQHVFASDDRRYDDDVGALMLHKSDRIGDVIRARD